MIPFLSIMQSFHISFRRPNLLYLHRDQFWPGPRPFFEVFGLLENFYQIKGEDSGSQPWAPPTTKKGRGGFGRGKHHPKISGNPQNRPQKKKTPPPKTPPTR